MVWWDVLLALGGADLGAKGEVWDEDKVKDHRQVVRTMGMGTISQGG